MLSVLRRWFCCCLLIFVIVPVVSHGFGIMSLLCFCSTLCPFFRERSGSVVECLTRDRVFEPHRLN